jgi:hypothetical protein
MVLKYRVSNIIWEGVYDTKRVVLNAMFEVLFGRLCIMWLVTFRSRFVRIVFGVRKWVLACESSVRVVSRERLQLAGGEVRSRYLDIWLPSQEVETPF